MLKVNEISYTSGQRIILNKISFDLAQGQLLCILGDNGAGKSTLIRILAGLEQAHTGQVLLNGNNAFSMNPQETARYRSLMVQLNPSDIPFTVNESLSMARYPYIKETAAQPAFHWISQIKENNQLNLIHTRPLKNLSGGEQQRAHFSRCLAQKNMSSAYLFLLDEPLNNLDIRYQHLIMQQIRQLCRQGNSAVLVLHDLNIAVEYADQFLILQQGEILAKGSREEVINSEILSKAFNIPVAVIHLPGRIAPLIIPGYTNTSETVFQAYFQNQK